LEELGLICGELGLQSCSTRGATVPTGTVHAQVVAAARVGAAQGTPAAGFHPRPTREKGFASNLTTGKREGFFF
jgi:hypothetical protein